MSWAAHDLEPYLLRAKLGARISIPFCLLGTYAPDILTKWAVYGLDFSGGHELVRDPVSLHRGWPGLGFTHTPFFALALAGLVYALTHSRLWATSFLVGALAHVLSDTMDSVGVMLLFPFSDWHFNLAVWEYTGQTGRRTDAIAYYTAFGGLWDAFWATWLAVNWRVLTNRYFFERILPTDPFWPWFRRKTNDAMMLTLYRTSAFFGIASIIAWFLWVLGVNDVHNGLSWVLGGPDWAPRQGPP